MRPMPNDAQEGDRPSDDRFRDLPPLYSDSSFWAITLTGFFGAFNDNLFKQLILLLSVPALVVSSSSAPNQQIDLQPLSMLVFALPFVLFSGFAGVWSDRFSKSRLVTITKLAEIVIMLLGVPAFFLVNQWGLALPLVVLFLMGVHSTFYGPAKYGILPELLRSSDLARATGVTLMATFLSIIFGTAAAGLLKDLFPQRLDLAQCVCVAVALLGAAVVYPLRRLKAAQPNLRFTLRDAAIAGDSLRLLRRDKPLGRAMLASCAFWLAAAIVQMAVNSYGKVQLALSDTSASILAAMIGIGIAFGSIVAGSWFSGSRARWAVLFGIWGLVVGLASLFALGLCVQGLNSPESVELLKQAVASPHALSPAKMAEARNAFNLQAMGYYGSLPVLIIIGLATGMFAVPVQVFLQERPPSEQKGRMIAAQSLLNWVAIFISAGLYFLFDSLLNAFQLPRCWLFACTALLMLPIAIFYRLPRSDISQEG